MAIGRGQGAAADKVIRASISHPLWVILENTHLAGELADAGEGRRGVASVSSSIYCCTYHYVTAGDCGAGICSSLSFWQGMKDTKSCKHVSALTGTNM
jgi:hypothetical protein